MQLTLDAYLLPYLFTSWSFFEKQNLTGPNFIDWYKQLCLVLSTKDKKNYLEHPIPAARVAPPGQQVPPQAIAAHAAWVKGQKEVDVLMLLTMDLEIQRNLAHLGAYDMIQELKAMYSKQAEHELLQTVREFHTYKQEKGQSVSSHVLKMKGTLHMGKTVNELHAMLKLHEESLPKKDVNPALHAIRAGRVQKNQKNKPHKAAKGGNGKGKGKMGNASFSSKPKTPPPPKKDNPAKNTICHQCGKVGHWRRNCPVYLAELLKKKKLSQGASTSGSTGKKMARKPYSHQVERAKDLLGLIHTDDYAFETAARILNIVSTKKVDKTPYEIWHMKAPKLSYLKVWGCEALVKRDTLTRPDKLDPRSFKSIFSKLLDLKASGSVEDLELIQEEDTNPSVDTSLDHEEDDQEIDKPQRDLGEPANYKAALLDPESKKWLDAMNVEIQSMKDNDVWVLVELPPNARTVGNKWLFKKKTDMDGVVYIFKARLVAKGFTQTYRVDYEETFSPVADIRAIRILIAIAAYYDYEMWQMDVKTNFLNRHLSEEVYIEQPEGFVNPKYPNHVCKLKHSIYGLKQASRQRNKRFDDEIKKFGFTQNPDEPCVYIKASGSYIVILILYVDDILLIGNNIPMLQDVKSYLRRSFAMKDLGEAAYILGIKIYRDRVESMDRILIVREKAIEEFLVEHPLDFQEKDWMVVVKVWLLKKKEKNVVLTKKEVVPIMEEVSLVDGVLEGAFGGKGDDDLAMGESV
uniref:Zinc finger, CCHC-type n=1 Tax=Tanacetum cinerariifolium TaxID=118510 RepID=A0A6L2JZS3_TANCI|nr:zinc finger, CCHC-type [Tanacetum cinerariifolium]